MIIIIKIIIIIIRYSMNEYLKQNVPSMWLVKWSSGGRECVTLNSRLKSSNFSLFSTNEIHESVIDATCLSYFIALLKK